MLCNNPSGRPIPDRHEAPAPQALQHGCPPPGRHGLRCAAHSSAIEGHQRRSGDHGRAQSPGRLWIRNLCRERWPIALEQPPAPRTTLGPGWGSEIANFVPCLLPAPSRRAGGRRRTGARSRSAPDEGAGSPGDGGRDHRPGAGSCAGGHESWADPGRGARPQAAEPHHSSRPSPKTWPLRRSLSRRSGRRPPRRLRSLSCGGGSRRLREGGLLAQRAGVLSPCASSSTRRAPREPSASRAGQCSLAHTRAFVHSVNRR